MLMADEIIAIARHFAAALDRCDYEEAAHFISSECACSVGTETLVGPQAIIASYRESSDWGARVLDSVAYESSVRSVPVGARVRFVDHITHRGQSHTYRCHQYLEFDAGGLITHILHEEILGEREALDAFFTRCGIRRR